MRMAISLPSSRLRRRSLWHHGLELLRPNANWAQVFPGCRTFTIGRDIEETSRSIATFSRADAGAWLVLYQRHLTAKPEIVAGMTSTPPSLSNEFAGKDAVDSYRFQFRARVPGWTRPSSLQRCAISSLPAACMARWART